MFKITFKSKHLNYNVINWCYQGCYEELSLWRTIRLKKGSLRHDGSFADLGDYWRLSGVKELLSHCCYGELWLFGMHGRVYVVNYTSEERQAKAWWRLSRSGWLLKAVRCEGAVVTLLLWWVVTDCLECMAGYMWWTIHLRKGRLRHDGSFCRTGTISNAVRCEGAVVTLLLWWVVIVWNAWQGICGKL